MNTKGVIGGCPHGNVIGIEAPDGTRLQIGFAMPCGCQATMDGVIQAEPEVPKPSRWQKPITSRSFRREVTPVRFVS